MKAIMKVIKILLWIIISYLIGSIPWGLIIGKVFFKKDIRNYGSGNLGGTNAGRVLGLPIGILVIVLDSFKALIMMTIANFVFKDAVVFSGLAVCIGHCFPVFANFKGGKAVACSYGYLLALGIYVTGDWVFTLLYPLLIFILVLSLGKIVSLSSMCGILSAAVIAFLTYDNKYIAFCTLILALFVIYRHRSNIIRIIQGKESKVSFIK